MLTTSKMLMRGKLETYKRWLEYIPDFWNIEEVLQKQSTDLSSLEIARLNQIKSDQKQVKIFTKFINIINKANRYKKIDEESEKTGDFFTEVIVSRSDSDELDQAIKKFDFNFYAKLKLEENSLAEINNIISLYNGTNKEELINQIACIDNIYIKDYALYLLNETAFQYRKKRGNKYLIKHC